MPAIRVSPPPLNWRLAGLTRIRNPSPHADPDFADPVVPDYSPFQGLMIDIPNRSESRTFRVAKRAP
jgi:hypothetical protein